VIVDRLSAEDARILARERGPVCGHVCKILVLDGRLDVDAVRARVGSRLAAVPRLSCRLVEAPLGVAPPAWLPVERCALDVHVRDGGRAEDEAGLGHTVASVMQERLDRARPLWALDVVAFGEQRTVLVLRLHHCMADGSTAMRMVQALLFDQGEQAPPAVDGNEPPGRAALMADALRWRGAAVRSGLARALSRRRGGDREHVRLAALRRELAPEGRPSPLARRVGRRRTVAFASFDLDDIKAVAHSAPERATVNDVVLAAVAGGLRRWFAHKGIEERELRVKVPVSLHQPGEPQTANRDSFMVVDLPLGHTDPMARLLAIRDETRERKAAHDADALDAFFHDLGRLSRSLERLGERWAMSPRVFALNVSNVPGPRGPLAVLRAPVLELRALAEVAQRHALRVAVVSAAGRLSFGLCADADAVDRLDLVSGGIADELRALRAALPAV
jgi:diacylglycerol O-acyltransferase / wax synthase